jgi:hypothetical protein
MYKSISRRCAVLAVPRARSTRALAGIRLSIVGGVKRDVHNGLELDRLPVPRRRPELPLAESIHGILVELLV